VSPQDEIKFIAEGELAGLVKLLRCLGLDCRYDGGASLPNVILQSATDERILITRKPLAETYKTKVVRVSADSPDAQLSELANIVPIADYIRPFSRCLKCNALLIPAPNAPAECIPLLIIERQLDLSQCPSCHRYYWEGSHVKLLRHRLQQIGLLDPNK
jgi:uncharacterized protein with PIN domain